MRSRTSCFAPNDPDDASATAMQITPMCTMKPPYRRGLPRTVPMVERTQPAWSAVRRLRTASAVSRKMATIGERREPERDDRREACG